MKKYPIFKHLIQFSNLVDNDGNYLSGVEIETKCGEEHKRHDRDNDDESDGAGYEGGDNDEGQKQNGTGVSS